MATAADIQKFFDALGPHVQLHQIGTDEPVPVYVAKVLRVGSDGAGPEYFSAKLLPIGAGPYSNVLYTVFTAPTLVVATPGGVVYQAQKPPVENEGGAAPTPQRLRLSTMLITPTLHKQAQDTIRWYESDE